MSESSTNRRGGKKGDGAFVLLQCIHFPRVEMEESPEKKGKSELKDLAKQVTEAEMKLLIVRCKNN